MGTEEFFRTMYSGDLRGQLQLFTLPDKRSEWLDPNDPAAIARAVARLNGGKNAHVYYRVSLADKSLVTRGRGEADVATGLPGLYAEIDIAGPNHKTDGEALPPSIEAAWGIVNRFPLKPSLAVFSGGGLHFYWLFREFWAFDTTDERDQAKELERRFSATIIQIGDSLGYHVDNVSDLARILRPVGTVNRKRGGCVPVRVVFASDDRYDASDFEPFLLEAVESQRTLTSSIPCSGDIPETARHNTLHKIVSAMRGRGLAYEDILPEAVLVNKKRCKPPLPQDELEAHVWDVCSRYSPNAPQVRAGVDPETGEIAEEEPAADGEAKPKRQESQSTRLYNIVRSMDGVDLFHTPDQEPYITYPVAFNGTPHRETARLGSDRSRAWLRHMFALRFNGAPGSQAVQDAINQLQAVALFEGEERDIHLRTGWHNGDIYIDLGDATWQAARVGAGGWEIVPEPPIKFRRTRGMMPLPVPERGGRLTDLRQFVNLDGTDRNGWANLAAWLVMALNPDGPYPVLCPAGPQGTAKSTLARMLRSLTDPNKAPLRSEPKNLHDLSVAAENAHMVCLDNLSGLPVWLSDGLCRLSTGGGAASRKLYTDDEEAIFDAKRPVILTGVNTPITREDLLDRTILLPLSVITDAKRRSESELLKQFEEARPRLFGALLDAMATALRRRDEVSSNVGTLPRMADFAIWAIAAETAHSEAGTFMAAYEDNRTEAAIVALEASPAASALVSFMENREDWKGTPSDLYKVLSDYVGERAAKAKDWPKSSKGLSQALRYALPTLRHFNIAVEMSRTSAARVCTVRRVTHDDASSDACCDACCDATSPPTPSNHAQEGLLGVWQRFLHFGLIVRAAGRRPAPAAVSPGPARTGRTD